VLKLLPGTKRQTFEPDYFCLAFSCMPRHLKRNRQDSALNNNPVIRQINIRIWVKMIAKLFIYWDEGVVCAILRLLAGKTEDS